MMNEAIGELVTPQKTAIMPRAAPTAGGSPRNPAAKQPKVAPMNRDGTISPPRYPPARETAVKTSFSRNAYQTACPAAACRMTAVPRPL